jgi:outer membrane translocation and assembly module TamA
MRAVVYLTAILIAGGCARHRARTPGEEYLEKIEVQGNKKLKSKTLIAGLALRRAQDRGRPPDPYQVDVDADRIRGIYLRAGYLDVDVRPRVERTGDAAIVIYEVDEGVRATTRVLINGVPPGDPELTVEKVRKRLKLRDGAPFDYAQFEAAKQPLVRVVEDAGYAHAKLDAKVYADRARHEAVISLDYTLGPKCVFGPITITGVPGELADAVRERLQFAEGEQYSTRAIVATQRALYGLGRFSTVQVQPAETASPVVAVSVAVSQSARRAVELGGGFGMDPLAYEVRGRAGYSIAGWPTPLMTSRVEFRPAYARLRDGGEYQPRMRALARLERQDLLWTYAKGDAEVGYSYLATLPYTSYGPRARLGFSTPLGTQRLQLRVGWGIEQLAFREISPALEPLRGELGLDGPQRIGAYTQAVSLDLRDHPIETTLGTYAEVRIAEGTQYAGGAFEFFEIVPEVRGYVPIPLPRPIVLAGRVRVGAIYGDLPITQRLFSGGASNHRGFGERTLAPFVIDDEGTDIPYGGGALLETSIEGRMRVARFRKMPITSVVFLDGGDVTPRIGDLSLGNLHWAVGTGVRLHTIVGPIRADLAYRLTRFGPMDPDPGSRIAFHLSLGEAF